MFLILDIAPRPVDQGYICLTPGTCPTHVNPVATDPHMSVSARDRGGAGLHNSASPRHQLAISCVYHGPELMPRGRERDGRGHPGVPRRNSVPSVPKNRHRPFRARRCRVGPIWPAQRAVSVAEHRQDACELAVVAIGVVLQNGPLLMHSKIRMGKWEYRRRPAA